MSQFHATMCKYVYYAHDDDDDDDDDDDFSYFYGSINIRMVTFLDQL